MIELSSLVKVCPKKVLLDSGAIGTFVSDAMVTAFKLKAQSDKDVQDLMLVDGIVVHTTGYM